MKKRYTEEQIIGFLREADAGVAIKDYADGMDFQKRVTTYGTASLAACRCRRRSGLRSWRSRTRA